MNWKCYKVSEFAEVIGGGTPKTSVAEYWNGDIPWITPKDLSSHKARYIAKGERNISQEGLKNSGAQTVPPNTVLLTSRAPVGYLAIAKNELTTNQGFRSLVVRKGFSPEFVYYLLINNIDYLKQHASGSTFQELSGGTLKNLEFQIPDYAAQLEIARILGDLDAKIELNQQMNKTLEAMAQAVFKEWFVGFEFLDAKDRAYKSSGGKLVNSELGPIPVGWKVVPLTELVDVLGGGTPSTGVSSFWDGEVPFFTPKDATDTCFSIRTEKTITQEGLAHCNSALFPQGTVFITARGTVGKVCMAGICMAMNQSCYALKGKELRQLYVFFLIKDIAQKLIQQSHGTVFEAITTQTFQRTMAVRPEAAVVNLFCAKVERLYDQILNNINESASLKVVRDSLLPKLMNGELST